jgi:hypothetical protein
MAQAPEDRLRALGDCEEIRGSLEEFEAMSGLSGHEARRRPNNVVSFLSHSGVLI